MRWRRVVVNSIAWIRFQTRRMDVETMDHFYALIMAGGGGTRLWPLSRMNRPKQMLPLVDERRTMFQISLERLEPLLCPEQIFVVTGRAHVDHLRSSAPQVPADNFVVEPFGQDSGPAAALGIAHIRHRDPDAVIAILGSDHHIADIGKFHRVLTAGEELARQHTIVTLGISPSFPSTGFGYIKRGESFGVANGFEVYHADCFTEKPDPDTAVHFLSTGFYCWNSGMFICTADRVFEELKRQQPEMAAQFDEILASIGTSGYQETLDRIWPRLKKISLDYAVMEQARNMVVIPVDMGWSDIGSWSTLFDVLDGDSDGNVKRGDSRNHIQIDTKETFIMSNRRVVTIGIHDIVIVDTDDVLLVCHRSRSEDVRQVVNQLRDQGDSTNL